MEIEDIIRVVASTVNDQAEKAAYNAGMGGEWGDGGASNYQNQLKYWLDGIRFAQTGETLVYRSIVNDYVMKKDSEFEEYQRLKKKFEVSK